jgi:branched-chain amino acid transport system substrate-binding protein
MAEWALKNGFKRAAILVNQSDAASVAESDYCIKAFEAGGGQIDKENGNGGDSDFRAQLSKISEFKPDALFIPWNYQNVALIAKQARELGYKWQFIGFDGWDSVELPGLAEGALEGGVYGSRPGFAYPEAKEFGEEYKAKFKVQLETECLFTRDGLYWIKQCLEKAGKIDPVALRDQLENTTHFHGLLGDMSIDPKTHNPTRDIAIFKVVGKQNVYQGIFK